ncbi:MAG: Uma2 family endonuclease [Saprospiraceae bacterium]
MATQAQKRLFTVEEYYKMAEVGILAPDARVELINGEIIEMSPIKSNHAGHVRRISTLLNEILLRKAIIDIQNPLHINAHSEPQPDIMVLKLSPDFYTSRHPKPEDVYLLIEVADTSVRYDREVKLPLYAAAGVPEVWIVNLKKRCVEQYRQPKDDEYTLHEVAQEDDILQLTSFDIKIEASAILG